ncbi:MAG: hypothetical protein QXF25_01760 [Candidatus Pacearchaeota archaeon]
MKKIYDSEVPFKYALYLTLLAIAYLAFAFVQFIVKAQTTNISILFIFPYLPIVLPYIILLFSLTLCWDIIAEEKWIHKIIGFLFVILTFAFVWYVWKTVGFPLLLIS